MKISSSHNNYGESPSARDTKGGLFNDSVFVTVETLICILVCTGSQWLMCSHYSAAPPLGGGDLKSARSNERQHTRDGSDFGD